MAGQDVSVYKRNPVRDAVESSAGRSSAFMRSVSVNIEAGFKRFFSSLMLPGQPGPSFLCLSGEFRAGVFGRLKSNAASNKYVDPAHNSGFVQIL